ncbi:DUF4350 domain-containing protein [Curtobacterium sp. RRHDQ10]|uniref:DUF4350 domain-containing protein n=1 Tax=Curtobacterium phyllosphaerae TaxID=3413379 RepID=UPI003BF10715
MSTATAATPPATAPRAGSAPGSGLRARVLAWGSLVLVGLIVAVAAGLAGRDTAATPAELDPASATSTGARALVHVLRDRGTRVDVVRDAAAATDAVSTGGTVFVDDGGGDLTPRVARRIAATAERVVLVSSDSRVISAFGLRAEPTAPIRGSTTVSTRDCPIDAAARAGRMTTAGVGYAVSADVTRCLPSGASGDRTWGLVRAPIANGTVTLIGATSVLENATITRGGNAAFALDLLGSGDRVTWFVPTPGGAGSAPSLSDLAPGWVTPVLVVGALVALAGAFWRGRRLGPLVVERLPVVVRAAETTEGRARLYERARDRTHALDTLRVAAVRRIARRLGLARGSHVDAVVEAAAAAVDRRPGEVGAVLVGGPAGRDADLVAGAAALAELESAIRSTQLRPLGDGSRRSTSEPDAPRRSGPREHPPGQPGARPDRRRTDRPGGRQ